MVKIIAKIISIVFHPLLLTTYLVLTLGIFFPTMLMIRPDQLWLVILFVFGFTFFIPAINILLFRYTGSIHSLQMETKKERVWPFIFISCIYVAIVFLFLFKLPFNANFDKLIALVAALVVASTLITFFYKVSVHSLAMGGWVGILLPLIKFSPALLFPSCLVIGFMGLVISSRLALDAHTPRETLVGCIAGLLIGYGGMHLLF